MFPEIFRDDVFRLETQRLWLRWPTARDESAIERLAGDREVAPMTEDLPHPYPKGGAGSFIYASRVENAQGAGLTFALAPVARPHDLLGVIALGAQDDAKMLRFWLGRPFWGRGLMSEAVETLVRAVFQLTALDAIAARVREDDAASRRVLEKAGFVRDGFERVRSPARDAAFDCVRFSRTRAPATIGKGDRSRDIAS